MLQTIINIYLVDTQIILKQLNQSHYDIIILESIKSML